MNFIYHPTDEYYTIEGETERNVLIQLTAYKTSGKYYGEVHIWVESLNDYARTRLLEKALLAHFYNGMHRTIAVRIQPVEDGGFIEGLHLTTA